MRNLVYTRIGDYAGASVMRNDKIRHYESPTPSSVKRIESLENSRDVKGELTYIFHEDAPFKTHRRIDVLCAAEWRDVVPL